jgi:hypothetical protein
VPEQGSPAINSHPLFPLRDIWPDVIERLQSLLIDAGEHELAATVPDLQVYDRCRCGSGHCATVYTLPRPVGAYGPGHRNVVFWDADPVDLDTGKRLGVRPIAEYMTVLDVIPAGIACIEILEDRESRRSLVAALPDVTQSKNPGNESTGTAPAP